MKYQVIGSSRDTGARMSLEFEAESKAAAERKASQQGMVVNHVKDITDGPVATATEPRPRTRRRGGGALFKLVIFAAILAALYYFVWPRFR
jgi:ferric-dicitrate binding protein FerR (iron transport regulator)